MFNDDVITELPGCQGIGIGCVELSLELVPKLPGARQGTAEPSSQAYGVPGLQWYRNSMSLSLHEQMVLPFSVQLMASWVGGLSPMLSSVQVE